MTTPPKKAGRPPLPEGEQRIKIMISLPPEEAEALDRVADEIGATRSGLIRRAVRDFIAARREGA